VAARSDTQVARVAVFLAATRGRGEARARHEEGMQAVREAETALQRDIGPKPYLPMVGMAPSSGCMRISCTPPRRWLIIAAR